MWLMLELSPDRIDGFNADGFVILDRIIGDQAVEPLRESLGRLFQGEFETGVTPDEVNWREGTGDPTLTRQICNGWRADRTIASTVLREDFGRAISRHGRWGSTRTAPTCPGSNPRC
jgi:hypothetical protein